MQTGGSSFFSLLFLKLKETLQRGHEVPQDWSQQANSGRGGKVSAVNVRKSLNLREGEALNKARMLGHTLCDKAVKTIGKLHWR